MLWHWVPLATLGFTSLVSAGDFQATPEDFKDVDPPSSDGMAAHVKALAESTKSGNTPHHVAALIDRFVDNHDGGTYIIDAKNIKASCDDFSCVTGHKVTKGGIEWHRYLLGDMAPYVVYRLLKPFEDQVYCTSPVPTIGNYEFECINENTKEKTTFKTLGAEPDYEASPNGKCTGEMCYDQLPSSKVTYSRATEDETKAFKLLASWRASEAYEAWKIVAETQKFTIDRLASGKVATALLLLFIYLASTILLFLGSLWVTWGLKWFKGPCDLKCCFVDKGLLAFWCIFGGTVVIWICLFIPGTVRTGLFPALITVTIYLCLAAIVQTIYCCKDPRPCVLCCCCKYLGKTTYLKKDNTPCDKEDSHYTAWRPCKVCCDPIYDPEQDGQAIDKHPFMGDDEDHCFMVCFKDEWRKKLKLWDNSDNRFETVSEYTDGLHKETARVEQDGGLFDRQLTVTDDGGNEPDLPATDSSADRQDDGLKVEDLNEKTNPTVDGHHGQHGHKLETEKVKGGDVEKHETNVCFCCRYKKANFSNGYDAKCFGTVTSRICLYVCNGPFRTLPYRETREQHNCKMFCSISFLTCFFFCMLIMFGYDPGWYQIVYRNEQGYSPKTCDPGIGSAGWAKQTDKCGLDGVCHCVVQPELQGKYTPRSFMFMYSFNGLARNARLDEVFTDLVQNKACGIYKQNKTYFDYGGNKASLTKDELKRKLVGSRIEEFVINMGDYIRNEWDQFYSVNDWFTRQFILGDILSPDPELNSPTKRPIAACNPRQGKCAAQVVSAPADARYLIFPSLTITKKFWLRDKGPPDLGGLEFTIKELLSGNQGRDTIFKGMFNPPKKIEEGKECLVAPVPTDGYAQFDNCYAAAMPSQDWLSKVFEDGAVVMARLAPQDYHRYHTMVQGRIIHDYEVHGTEVYSVNYEAMPSDNGAVYNTRRVTILWNAEIGYVGYVNLGAACTSSIVQSTVAVNSLEDSTGDALKPREEDYVYCPRPQADCPSVQFQLDPDGNYVPGQTAKGDKGAYDKDTMKLKDNEPCTDGDKTWEIKNQPAARAEVNKYCTDIGLNPRDTVGHYYKYRGDESGYFQYGGSTIVMVFQKNKIDWDPDLMVASSRHDKPVETFMYMGQMLGKKKDWSLADYL